MPRPTEQELYERAVLSCSVERMINSTLELLMTGEWKGDQLEELRDINHQDWEEMKHHVVKMWNEERNRIFMARQARQDPPG